MSSSQSSSRIAATSARTSRTSGVPVLDLLGRLTDRDHRILEHLADHRVLTASMIAELLFGSLRHAQVRLKTLTELGLLIRFRRRFPAGTQPYRYVLGHHGAVIIAHQRGQKPPTPRAVRTRAERIAAGPDLSHTLGVNAFFTALAYAGRQAAGASVLSDWWSEQRTRKVFGRYVRPDAYGRWRAEGRSIEFFLEYDTGTERPATRLADKLPGYAALASTLGHPVHLLFWLPTPAREATARRALEPALPGNVHVATATPSHGEPAEGVWLPIPGDRRVRLTALAEQAHAEQAPSDLTT